MAIIMPEVKTVILIQVTTGKEQEIIGDRADDHNCCILNRCGSGSFLRSKAKLRIFPRVFGILMHAFAGSHKRRLL